MPVIIHDFEIVVEEPEAPPAPPSAPPSARPEAPTAPTLRPLDVHLILRREARRAERVRAH